MDLSVTTTARETFTTEETRQMARLVYKRFGRDLAVATLAWRRMLQNSATESDFARMVAEG